MRAIISNHAGGPDSLSLEDIGTPQANPGEVIVDIRAIGVNFADTLIIEDKYQFRPERPFSPGGELSGVITALGDGVTSLKVGDRIAAYSCFNAMREQIALPANVCVKLPDAMDFDIAAGFMITYGSSYYGLKQRGQLRAGETLLITGAAGGVGVTAIELGKVMGAHVIAAVSSEDKAEFCRSKGADDAIIYPRAPLDKAAQKALSQQIRAQAGDRGVDVIYDAIGGDYAEPALRTLNWGGRYLVIGFASGIPAMPLNLPMLKTLDIRGVFWGAWAEKFPQEHATNVAEMMQMFANGQIRPEISAHYPLERAADALTALKERRAHGKIVVEI
ncbi:MAG: NADPH:quinone oxidoreductase [Hirschia sp.]|nr:NADPH:quinone oxidoreductase [Hirschia sp.]MBF18402.1 NADPH:quinone oxidoreductase [Hirschia sp.]MBF18707.1 NADPH:quinone oxidoreductase [Hirschia sp.]MBF20319.1 NADPH:quinone oxidoreductase [Hirschia sp.]